MRPKSMKKYIVGIAALLVAGLVILNSCRKDEVVDRIEPDEPANPYDGVDYGSNPNLIPIDSASFLGIHQTILSTKCAQPACHDGAFEPDYRTVQSAYNTLVYANTVSNNQAGDFTYRVLPGDTAMSWLHERITTDDPVLGRMPLYDTLYPHQISNIEHWILHGAEDIFGNSPIFPDYEPTFFGVLAYENDTTGMRLDTIRDTEISAIHLPQNTDVELWFGLYDIDQNGTSLPGYDFTYNKIKFSDNPYDFAGVAEYSMNVENALTPFLGPLPFGGGGQGPYYHSYTINTSNFVMGRTYYMRVMVQDTDHSSPTEIPENGTQIYLMTYFSFIVQ
jgi:hypothetical protein